MTYNPNRCDLCGSDRFEVLIELSTDRALSSDRRIMPLSLRKYRCSCCGLVRQGDDRLSQSLADYYGEEYTTAPPDYEFYTDRGPVRRSALFCLWMTSAFGSHRWKAPRRCLEIGAGAGAVIAEFKARFPDLWVEGFELCKAAARQAEQRGLPVREGGAESVSVGAYDTVYSIAVIEHVPSPTRFLHAIRRALQPGGLLFLCQPTQEVPSYDVFFVDHLYHFGAAHLRGFAQKCGFREVGLVVGHEWMPNFSLHLWETAQTMETFSWCGPPAPTACAEVARTIIADMQRLDATLKRLEHAGRRVAVFGLNEVFALARAYSQLGAAPIVCGLDDKPDNPAYAGLGFPVVAPEDCRRFGVQDVILAVNKVYYPQLGKRLGALGVDVHPVL
jgi:SAM-dependent methyltransferase